MGLFRAVKRYKRKLEKRFAKQKRTQLNFACDKRIVMGLRLLTRDLEVPMYPLCERLLQLGVAEVAKSIKDESLKEELCRHLIQKHLLVPAAELEAP
jgi:hypothetical protein